MPDRRLVPCSPWIPALCALCTIIFAGRGYAQAPHEVAQAETAGARTATELYLQAISKVGSTPLSDSLERKLLHTWMVMSAEDRLDAGLQDGLSRLPEDAGVRLVDWWNEQDPLPNTMVNERLEEHLSRVEFALGRYASEADDRGFDDRGEIFVRLGPPEKRHIIRLPETMRAFDFTNVASVPRVPANELWIYGHLSPSAYYVFIGDGRKGAYREAQPHELIPFRESVGRYTSRTRNITEAVLLVMEEVYGQLALAHPSFGPTYDRISTYRVSKTMPGLQRPDTFVRNTIADAAVSEVETTGRRDDEMPQAFSNPFRRSDPFPADVRTARFLNDDGTTRLEIAWGVQIEALKPSDDLVKRLREEGHEPSDRYLVAFSAGPRQSETIRRFDTKYYLLDGKISGPLPAPTFEVADIADIEGLSLQWEQFWVTGSDPTEPKKGPRLRIGARSLDVTEPLHASGKALEMSDLKPVLQSKPYPFETLSPHSPIALYFELYNLHFGPEDRTDYAVEYEVSRRGGRSDAGIRARTEYQGESRTAREYIELDLRDWEGNGVLEINVRAVDNVTAEESTRMIEFTLRP